MSWSTSVIDYHSLAIFYKIQLVGTSWTSVPEAVSSFIITASQDSVSSPSINLDVRNVSQSRFQCLPIDTLVT